MLSTWEQIWKWIKKNKEAFIFLAGMGVFIFGVLVALATFCFNCIRICLWSTCKNCREDEEIEDKENSDEKVDKEEIELIPQVTNTSEAKSERRKSWWNFDIAKKQDIFKSFIYFIISFRNLPFLLSFLRAHIYFVHLSAEVGTSF